MNPAGASGDGAMSDLAERFVIAVPFRTDYYQNYASILNQVGALRLCCLWTRRGFEGVPPERHRLFPLLGLTAYAAARTFSLSRAEALRFALHPWFDRWTEGHLRGGDHVISSYGYANRCFRRARQRGGKTFLDGGNSHPENFWTILEEEHRRWNCAFPPVPKFHIDRSLRMMEDVDFVMSPSSYVTGSFLARGFRREQILDLPYATDLSRFRPPSAPRPADRPLTVINTGMLSLRKGSPYLLEAFRLILREEPRARLMLTELVSDSIRPILSKYADLPIDWAPPLPHAQLAERLNSADIFVLPSLEEGLARTSLEAMACGLPVVVTPNTGSNDLVIEGVNGSVVPIRDAEAIAGAVLGWWQKIRQGTVIAGHPKVTTFDELQHAIPSALQTALG